MGIVTKSSQKIKIGCTRWVKKKKKDPERKGGKYHYFEKNNRQEKGQTLKFGNSYRDDHSPRKKKGRT